MKKTLLLALTICLTSSAFAINWQMVGARQAGMGGAGVSIAQGTDVQYYNPALLNVDADYDEMDVDVTAGAQGKYIPTGRTEPDKFFVKYRSKADADAGIGVRKGNLAFTVRSLGSIIARPDPSVAGKTRVDMGIVTEAALGYGFTLLRGISVGANIKLMEGTVSDYSKTTSQWDLGFGGMMKEVWYNKEFSTTWGVDVGAAIDFSEFFQSNVIFHPTVAIVGKNLNNPKFKRSTANAVKTSKIELGRQARIGAAIHPLTDRLTITGDYDLTENETIVKDVKSQQIAGGIEVMAIDRHTFQLPIRFGISKDLENSDEPLYLTAGFATITPDYNFGLSFIVGDSMEEVNGHDLPNALGVTMSFSWLF